MSRPTWKVLLSFVYILKEDLKEVIKKARLKAVHKGFIGLMIAVFLAH